MSDSTRQEFDRLVENFLDASPGSPVHTVVGQAGYSVRRLRFRLGRPPDDIRSYKFTDPNDNNTEKDLTDEQYKELVAFVPYTTWLQNSWGPPAIAGYVNLEDYDRDHFLMFMATDYDETVRDYYNRTEALENREHRLTEEVIRSQIRGTPTTTTSSTTSSSTGPNMVSNFQKSMKRDRSLFTVFRRDYDYHNWIRDFKAMCDAQGVSDVLNSSHSPQLGTEEYDLFVLQNQFLYSVFIQVLKAAKGEEIVKDHENGGVFRAQKVYRDLVAHYTKSSAATNRADQLNIEIITDKASLPDPIASQISKFKDKMREFNSLKSNGAKMDPDTQLMHLRRFTADVQELKNVETVVDLGNQIPGTNITSEGAMSLYETRARKLDHDMKMKLSQRGGANRFLSNYTEQRQANILQAYEVTTTPSEVDDDDGPFQVQAYYGEGRRRVSLNRETCSALSAQDLAAWDTLSDAGKNTILTSRRSFRGSRPTPSANQVSPGADREANMLSICDRANDDVDDEGKRIDINRALSTPSASADDVSGLTILEAVRNPVSKDKFEAILNNYPPGHMCRFLSSSNVVENAKPGTSTGENVLQGIDGGTKTSKNPKVKRILNAMMRKSKSPNKSVTWGAV